MSGVPTLSATQSRGAFFLEQEPLIFHFEITLGVEISFLGVF